MTSMTATPRSPSDLKITAGVDCHADTHSVVALDSLGRRIGAAKFAASTAGYQYLETWLRELGTITAIGVESTSGYGAGLTRHLRAGELHVIEVNQPHAHARARRGKTDAIDAEMAARKILSGEIITVPKDTTGVVESIRQLKVVRSGAVKARAAAMVTMGQLIVTAPAALREHLNATTAHARAAQSRRLRPDLTRLCEPTHAAKLALRTIGRQIEDLDLRITELDQALEPLVRAAAPRTIELLGVGVQHAAQLLLTAGQNGERLPNEAAFAHLCGVSPIQASSGKTNRHRLNRGGDRQANRALHMIIVVRLRYSPITKAYLERRLTQGKTKREAIRCLKRYLAREIFRTITADLKDLAQST